MPYIEKTRREQIMLLPECLEDYVGADNPVRVIDAFVESLDLCEMGFGKNRPAETGRPAYDPRDLLKLYVYGYYNRIRSSRRLMAECGRNVELFWLMGRLKPDFRTIADFRKDNAACLRLVFRAFVVLCNRLGLYKKELLAVDGSKLRAQNSSDRCYNAAALERKLANIDAHISEYLRAMDKTDEREQDSELTAEQVKTALEELHTRKNKYAGYLETLRQTGATQILETDPQAHRMHSKDGFHCCYNVQTAVDGGSHLIAGYEATDHNTDQGLLSRVCADAKELLDVQTIEAVADKGYESRRDILDCLMNGILPNVAMKYDKTERVFNLAYEAWESPKPASAKPEDIKRCLRAGILPDCYRGSTVSVEVQEQNEVGCFTRNDDGTVTCPMGHILSKIKKKGESDVYAGKDACRQCKNRCTSSMVHKTVLFGPGTKYVAAKIYGDTKHKAIPPPEGMVFHNSFKRIDIQGKKKVIIRIREDKEKLKQRMCLSEHPFGTVKWYHGAHYLLCRGKEKVNGELGLSFLAYNLRRAITLMGVPALLAGIKG